MMTSDRRNKLMKPNDLRQLREAGAFSPRARITLTAAGVMIMLTLYFGVNMFANAAATLKYSSEVATWPTVEARIVKIETNEIIGDEGTPEFCRLPTYEFTQDGDEFESNKYAPAGMECQESEEEAVAAFPEFQVGAVVTVHVNPDDANASFIAAEGDHDSVREQRSTGIKLLVVGLLALLVVGRIYLRESARSSAAVRARVYEMRAEVRARQEAERGG
jgi:hypothetical protein